MMMEQQQFTNPQTEGWWLTANELDNQMEDRRSQVAVLLGTNERQWYGLETLLLKLWTEMGQDRDILLRELDEAADDASKRLNWLDRLIEALTPEEEEEEEGEEEGSEQSANSQSATQALKPNEAPKPSIFAKKQTQQAEQEQAPQQSEQSEGAQQASAPTNPQASQASGSGGLFGNRPAAANEPADTSAAQTAEAAAEVLGNANIPEEAKQVLEDFITNSAVPVSADEVAEVLNEFGDDFEKVFSETEDGLEQEIADLFTDIEENEDETEEVSQ